MTQVNPPERAHKGVSMRNAVDASADQLRAWQEKVERAEKDHEAAERIRDITAERLSEARQGLEITKASALMVLSEHRPETRAMGLAAKAYTDQSDCVVDGKKQD